MSDTDFTDLVDLAAGGAALLANDEFFAEKENLLRPHEAEWREHEYTDRGKWMDGWETRRRREPGYDWCVVRLGLPGIVRGVVVDTAFFRGNYPAECSLEACELAGPLDLAELAGARWEELVPRAALQGHTKNRFAVTAARRFTHVRLNLFPDGGVARLRVHGEVVPDWARLAALGGPIDLAALEHGAQVLACSDMFFGNRANLIKPGRPVNMSDGWETRRRRGPGHDWSIIQLGAPGVIRRAEIDTTHFKGNAPGRCTLEACHAPGATLDALTGAAGAAGAVDWRPVLGSALQPHTRHFFADQLRAVGPVTHARLSVFPDGGVARLRLVGDPIVAGDPTRAGVTRLNALPRDEAVAALRACCGGAQWAERVAAARPFEDLPALVRTGDRVWWALAEADWLEAFAAHPQIGAADVKARWAADEQAGARAVPEATLDALAEGNRAYQEKFGFIFIVCATGKGAEEMLALLQARLGGTRAAELRTAAEEQAKITQLRLRKLVSADASRQA